MGFDIERIQDSIACGCLAGAAAQLGLKGDVMLGSGRFVASGFYPLLRWAVPALGVPALGTPNSRIVAPRIYLGLILISGSCAGKFG